MGKKEGRMGVGGMFYIYEKEKGGVDSYNI